MAIDQLAGMFHAQDKTNKTEHESYCEFILDGTTLLQDVVALYGDPTLDQPLMPLKLDQAIRRKIRRYAAEGDAVPLGGLSFTVHSVNPRYITNVGVKLPKKERQ